MPNRKTFDDREKYDHSAHRPEGQEQGDLEATPNPAEEHDGAERSGEKAEREPVPTSSRQPTL